MNKKLEDLRIVFLGTPDFAVASLDALVANHLNVVAVVTAPDKPAGRGMHLHQSAVKKYAVEKGIPVLQPDKLKSAEFLTQLQSLHADLQVVVAFRMLPELVWNMPPMGTINVHASLLPQYRGAAPINRAIMNGEKETGVTTFKLKQEIDTGAILLQEKITIQEEDDAGSLHDKLMQAGAGLLVATIRRLADGTIQEQPQDSFPNASLKHAPKIFKEDMRIDWNHDAQLVLNQIRGLSPYPAAFTFLHEKQIKVYNAHIEIAMPTAMPGDVESDGKSYLKMATKNGWVYIDDLQMEGKKRMKIADFLRGYRLP